MRTLQSSILNSSPSNERYLLTYLVDSSEIVNKLSGLDKLGLIKNVSSIFKSASVLSLTIKLLFSIVNTLEELL